MAQAIELKSSGYICPRCGKSYGTRKGNFPISFGDMYKGTTYLPWCGVCIDELYGTYIKECGNPRQAMLQLCRKFDLYWNENVYNVAASQSAKYSLFAKYMNKLNHLPQYHGKSYDDSLREAGTLWNDPMQSKSKDSAKSDSGYVDSDVPDEDVKVSDETRERFGPGYTNKMYAELEQRYQYWMGKLPAGTNKDDMGTQALMQQLCATELDINRQRARGESTDRSVKVYNDLLASLALRPVQKKDDDANAELAKVPLGVWLARYEHERPLPEVPDELKENKIKKYIFTWMGHLTKMMGIKNGYTRLYEEEIARLKVDRPEPDDEDEESLIIEAYSEGEEQEEQTGEGGDIPPP